MGKLIDEVGHKFGRLTVIERSGSTTWGFATWLCRCECGKAPVVVGASLRSGDTKSCGCLHRELVSLPEGEAAFNEMLRHMQSTARRRNYEWQLTKEQVHALTQQSCYYCGAKPNQGNYSTVVNGAYIYNGLDRINNDRGYTIDNVVPCCVICNKAKNTLTTEQFKIWIRRIYEHFGKSPIDGVT